MISLIVCYSKNRVIGRAGAIPWHYQADLARFKKITMGHTLIMGRKTFDSLRSNLPGRKIIIVSQKKINNDTAPSLKSAIEMAKKYDDSPIICGGEEIYKQALPLVEKMYITEIDKEYSGDTFFPEFDEKNWKVTEEKIAGKLTFKTLIKPPSCP